jgi:hypothetical protein
MFEAFGAVIAAVIKAGVPIYVSALIASTLLLFLPDSIASQIGIAEFRQLYRGYLGLNHERNQSRGWPDLILGSSPRTAMTGFIGST